MSGTSDLCYNTPIMLDYERELYSPGRRCPLTEERCHSRSCESKCYGLEAAKGLKKIMHGDLAHVAQAFRSTVGHLPLETQKAVAQYVEGRGDLSVFENFMDDRV